MTLAIPIIDTPKRNDLILQLLADLFQLFVEEGCFVEEGLGRGGDDVGGGYGAQRLQREGWVGGMGWGYGAVGLEQLERDFALGGAYFLAGVEFL